LKQLSWGGHAPIIAQTSAAISSAARRVEHPLSPRVLASLVANVFQGIEIELLAGVTEEEAPHREALEGLGRLIAQAEAGG
jgi:hypothetical protein